MLSSCLSKSSFSSSFLWIVCLSSDTFLSACVSCCLRSSFSRSLNSYADSISDKLLWAASSFSSKSSIWPNLYPWSVSSWEALCFMIDSSSSRSPMTLRAAFNCISRSFTFSWALAYESSTVVNLLVTRYRSFWISSFSDRSEVKLYSSSVILFPANCKSSSKMSLFCFTAWPVISFCPSSSLICSIFLIKLFFSSSNLSIWWLFAKSSFRYASHRCWCWINSFCKCVYSSLVFFNSSRTSSSCSFRESRCLRTTWTCDSNLLTFRWLVRISFCRSFWLLLNSFSTSFTIFWAFRSSFSRLSCSCCSILYAFSHSWTLSLAKRISCIISYLSVSNASTLEVVFTSWTWTLSSSLSIVSFSTRIFLFCVSLEWISLWYTSESLISSCSLVWALCSSSWYLRAASLLSSNNCCSCCFCLDKFSTWVSSFAIFARSVSLVDSPSFFAAL